MHQIRNSLAKYLKIFQWLNMILWENNFVKNKSNQKPYIVKLKTMIADISATLSSSYLQSKYNKVCKQGKGA